MTTGTGNLWAHGGSSTPTREEGLKGEKGVENTSLKTRDPIPEKKRQTETEHGVKESVASPSLGQAWEAQGTLATNASNGNE